MCKTTPYDNRIDIVGRRVKMAGSVWNMDPKLVFKGLVKKKKRYKGRTREWVDGYEVKWRDGPRENCPYEFLLPCLVVDNTQLDEDPCLRQLRESCNNVDVDIVGVEGDEIVVVNDNVNDPEKDEYEGEYLSDEEIIPEEI